MKLIKSVFIVFLVVFCFVIPTAAEDETMTYVYEYTTVSGMPNVVTTTPVTTVPSTTKPATVPGTTEYIVEPRIHDLSFFPALPADFFTYTYRIILKRNSDGVYLLLLNNNKPVLDGTQINLLYNFTFYTFNSNLSKKEWLYSGITSIIFIKDYSIIYNENDIFEAYGNLIIKKSSTKDFIFSSIALAKLQYLIKNNLSFIVQLSIFIMTAFIMLRIIAKMFKPKDKHTSKKAKLRYKQKGRRFK